MSVRSLGQAENPQQALGLAVGERRRTASQLDERVLSPTNSDEEITAGLQRGEAWAADRLYERVHIPVQKALQRVLRYGDGELEDLMQESFERIIGVLSDRPLGGACNLPAWASAVATHLALDRLRRRARERKIMSAEPIADGRHEGLPIPERKLEARNQLQGVQATLARMRPKHAEALLLHDVMGHNLVEVAELAGVSVAAAQSRLVRARREFLRRAGASGAKP